MTRILFGGDEFHPLFKVSTTSLKLAFLLLLCSLVMQSCSSPFQVKEDYSPRLVIYGIAFRGDSALTLRVQTNSKDPIADPNHSEKVDSLTGSIVNGATGEKFPLRGSYVDTMNWLQASIPIVARSNLLLAASASRYASIASSLTVLDSATIYVADAETDAKLRNRFSGSDTTDLKFLVYPSHLTKAIRGTLDVVYDGIDGFGSHVSGEIVVNPAYQVDTTAYLLRVNGQLADITFNLRNYMDALSLALNSIRSGTIYAVVKVTQVDAALYDFYSISHGFNQPFTFRTERPVYTNIVGGLGFFGSASNDSLAIKVYP